MGFFDNIGILDFWGLGVIALVIIAWKVLARFDHNFRAWVVPTFCALALLGNIATLAFIDRSPEHDVDDDISIGDELDDEDQPDEDYDVQDEEDEDPYEQEPVAEIHAVIISINDDLRGDVDVNEREAEQGTSIVLRAAANAGYEFDHWEVVSGGIMIENSFMPNASFTMPDNDVSIRVYFRQESVAGFTITTDVNDAAFGTAAANPEEAAGGSRVDLSADASDGYEFERWEVITGEIILSDVHSSTAHFTMPDSDVSIRAHFSFIPESFEITTAANNSVFGEAQAEPYLAAQGEQVVITATAAPGFEFERWEVLSGGVMLSDVNSPTASFTMPNSDVNVTAVFARQEQKFSVVAIAQTISDSTELEFTIMNEEGVAGQMFSINAGGVYGFEFRRWEVLLGGVVIENANSTITQFLMPENDVIVRAVFEAIAVP